MKTQAMFAVVAAAFSLNSAHAIVFPAGHERPIQGAEMKVTNARFGFKDVKYVELTMTKQDESQTPTGFVLKFDEGKGKKSRTIKLVVTDVRDAGCGSVEYFAHLEGQDKDPVNGARFGLTLTDHTKRVCEDYKPYLWEAHVREGYGWCGTMDSTMEFIGNPEEIYTIQSLEK